MKYLFLIPLFFFYSEGTFSQCHIGHKPIVDFKAIDNWIEIGPEQDLAVSYDGKYFAYTIQNKSTEMRDIVVVQSTSRLWKKEFKGAKQGFFSKDSKQYIFQDKDSLFFLQLGGELYKFAGDLASYKINDKNNCEWLACQLNNYKKTVVLLNLLTGIENKFDSVANYSFVGASGLFVCQLEGKDKKMIVYNPVTDKKIDLEFVLDYAFDAEGEVMVMKTNSHAGDEINTIIKYINLENGLIKCIWNSTDKNDSVNKFVLDKSAQQLAFLTGGKRSLNSVWYYRTGMDRAEKKLNDQALSIQGIEFTDNGKYILLTLEQQQNIQKAKLEAANVDIWSYQDTILPSNSTKRKSFVALYNLENSRFITLENRYEKLKALKGDFAVVAKVGSEVNGDRFWENNYNSDSNYLVSLKDGSRKLLKTNVSGYGGFWFSPEDKYLVYFDPEQQCNYFSYNLHSGNILNISSGIPAWQLGLQISSRITKENPKKAAGVMGWKNNDLGFLVYDNYDIWLLNLTGKRAPINITNGYGRSHKVKFDLDNRLGNLGNAIFRDKQLLLLKAFNTTNKNNGFFQKRLEEIGDPDLIYMGPYIISGQMQGLWGAMQPLKANDADVWIVKRQSAIEAPNYFLTRDFKDYTRLTDIQPQKKYNWLTAELCEFKHLDGRIGQGILYKPENFDPNKKYPVLIVIYDQHTNRLYQFPTPEYNWSAIAPAESPILFLNQGYLVFTPDMYIAPLKYGPSAFNVVEGAAKYLRQLPYVDGKHIGAAAHSWSAKLGSYIFTHSHTLSAIAISEGFVYADLINSALSINEEGREIGKSRLETVEKDFEFGNLWKNKSTWLDQTTILNVDKATSPLLLYCNKQSLKDYQNQTTQLFTALRRLEKPVWWLSYDSSGHTLEPNDAKDYTIRYLQFFNHYLKNEPAPVWMTQGIPARLKGIETGYTYDPSGNCGKDCKVCKYWNEKFRKDPSACWKEIEERKIKENCQ